MSEIKTQGQGSEINVSGLAALLAEQKKTERALRRAMTPDQRIAADLAEMEATKLAKYPNCRLVKGSLRIATESDRGLFASTGRHCHGTVGEIVCVDCSRNWLVNAQDAHQTVRCASCQEKVAKAKAKKTAKPVDVASLLAKKAAIEARLASARRPVDAAMAEVTEEQTEQMTDEQIGDLVVEGEMADVLAAIA